jgi:hypothetical protein
LHWTKQEIETLRQLYPTSKQEIILKALPTRTWESIGSKAYRLKIPRPYVGELNHFWHNPIKHWKERCESDDYITLHQFLRKRKPKPETCECCHKSKPYDLANINGEYNQDLANYEWLCRKCHMTKDGRLERFKHSTRNCQNAFDAEIVKLCPTLLFYQKY